MAKLVSYDKEADIFAIHKGFSHDEKFKGNIDAGDIVLDLSSQGKIKGLEIMHAIKFFRDMGIDKKALLNMETADFHVSVKPSGIAVKVMIKQKSRKTEQTAAIQIPMEYPIVH